jgi:hypothetical protein
MRQRLKELERKSAHENFVLTESQVAALQKKKNDDLACGEIEIVHPGSTLCHKPLLRFSKSTFNCANE